jgi:uncharacterized phage protein (TIGR02220 family)
MMITMGKSNAGWMDDSTLSIKQKGFLAVFYYLDRDSVSLELLALRFSDSIGVIKNVVMELVSKGYLGCDMTVKPKRDKSIPTQDEIDIINYLNQKLGLKPPKGFTTDNTETVHALNAILERYDKEDVKSVIDLKCRKWIGTEWQGFLRPKTLFNKNKFEGYVNEIDCKGSQVRESTPLQMLE